MSTVWQQQGYIRPTNSLLLAGIFMVCWQYPGKQWVIVADTKSYTHTMPLPKHWNVLTRDTQ